MHYTSIGNILVGLTCTVVRVVLVFEVVVLMQWCRWCGSTVCLTEALYLTASCYKHNDKEKYILTVPIHLLLENENC